MLDFLGGFIGICLWWVCIIVIVFLLAEAAIKIIGKAVRIGAKDQPDDSSDMLEDYLNRRPL